MSRPTNKPKPVHLGRLDEATKPACITGRGEVTVDLDAVTCPRCSKSDTMTRILMRRKHGEVER
jgi:hypothetical protein